MARKLVVEIVGDSSSLDRAFRRSEKSAAKFGRDVSKATRGAAAGSGIFRGFGRSIAFASGGFIAFESLSSFLRSSIDAARDAAVAQRSLAAQMKASGQSFQANREQIEKVSLSYGKFGFQNDEVVQSLTVLERGTGNINEAIRLQGLTADLARAKNIGLADAAQTVAKVFGGQETALRRAVPGLAKNAHGYDLIREAQQRLAGQAAANTTTAERFQAALHNTEEIIGTALLPTLNKYLGQLSKWLNNTENQKKIQKDATAVASGLATAFTDLGNAVGFVKTQWDRLPDFGKSHGLLDLVKELGAKGPHIPKGPSLLDILGIGGGGGVKAITGGPDVEAFLKGIRRNAPGVLGGPAAGAAGRAGRPFGLAGRFNIQELKLAQAQMTQTQADDRRILVVEKAITEQQIKQAKSLKDRIQLTQQLGGIVGQIRGIDQQAADAVKAQAQARKDAAKAVADAAKAAKEAAKARQSARLQTGLDWLDFGLEKAQATKKVGDDVAAEKKIIAALKDMVRQTGLTVDLARQIFEHRQALADLLKQKKSTAAANPFLGIDAPFGAKARPSAFFGGPAAFTAPKAFAPFIPAGAVAARGGGFVINGGLHLHGVQDIRKLEDEIQKRAKQRQQPRRGQ